MDALEATGLGLPVYIDSGLRNENNNEVLVNTTVDERAFIDEDNTKVYPNNADSRLEVLEGILAAHNCSVRQSMGRWYIFNNSTYNGTGANESITWLQYTYTSASNSSKIDGTNYIPATNVTENVRQDIDGTSSTNLFVKDESLFVMPRYPHGSVEARFQSLRPLNVVPNPNFDQNASGWAAHSSSIDSTLSIDTTGGLDESNAITTNRTRRTVDANSDIWFETAAASSIDISRGFGHKLKFKWNASEFNSNVRSVEMKVQVYVVFSSSVSKTSFSGSANIFDWFAAILGNSSGLTSTVTSNRLYHNFSDQKWKLDSENGGYWDWSSIYYTAKSNGGWREEEIDLGIIGNAVTGPGGGATFPDEKPNVYVRFFYPEAKNSNGNGRGNSTSDADVWIDDIEVKGNYEGEDIDVVFERFQDDYTTTSSYEPNVIGDDVLDQEFYEILSNTTYWESGQNVNSDDSRSLEQLVTNQKLKDYQSQFYYYEADLVNNTAIPLGQHNKVKLSLTDENRTVSFIQNGGRFNVKDNVFSVGMYEPNQTGGTNFGSTDNGGPFVRENINLIGSEPPDRPVVSDYVLSFDIVSNDDDGTSVANGILPANNNFGVIISNRQPGELVEVSFDLRAADDYEIDGTVTLDDTASRPLPTYIESSEVRQVGSVNRVTLVIRIPEEDEYEVLYITGTIDELVGDNSRVILSVTDSMTNATVTEGTSAITEIGPEGATETFYYHIVPSATYEMTTTALTVTLNSVKDGNNSTDTDVTGVIDSSDIQEIQAGTGVIVGIPFKYSNTSPVYAKLTFSGAATTIASTDTVTAQLTVSEAGTDTSNWSIADTSHTFTCVPGTPLLYPFEINPESGRTISASSVTVGSVEESWLDSTYVTASGELSSEATVWFTGTCPTVNSTAAATINVTTGAPSSTDAALHAFTWASGTGYILNGGTQFNVNLQEGETATFNIPIEAAAGNRLGTQNLETKAYTYDITNGTLPTGVTRISRNPYVNPLTGDIENIDFTFQVVGQSTAQSGTISFTGTAGTQTDQYKMRILINSTDAFNATINNSIIEVPFGGSDLGDADGTDRTFTVQSADSGMQYTAVGDITVTSSNTTLISQAATNITKTISSGVITVTISSLTYPTTPGDVDVTLTVAGAVPTSNANFVDATTATITNVTSSTLKANTGVTVFTVTANGAWRLRSTNSSGTPFSMPAINASLMSFSPDRGNAGTFNVTAYPRIVLGTNGRLVNSNGSDNNSGATSGTSYFSIQGLNGSTNLDTDDVAWSAISGDTNVVNSLDVQNISVLTQTQYDALSTPDSNTFYLIST